MTHARKPTSPWEALRLRNEELERENAQLRRALGDREVLQDLVTLCAGCKRIRDESDTWVRLETFLADRFDVKLSHGLCPDCVPDYGFRPR